MNTRIHYLSFRNNSAIISASISFGLFIALCMGVVLRMSWLIQWDQMIYHILIRFRTPLATQFFLWISSFNVELFCLFVSIVSIWLMFQGETWRAWHWISMSLLTLVVTVAFKNTLAIARPHSFLTLSKTGSFPSAHVIMNDVFLYCFLQISNLGSQRNSVFRVSNYSLHAIWVLLVCSARLYLAAHWFSDVLGGLLLSISLGSIFHVFYSRQAILPLKKRYELLYLSFGTLIIGALIIFLRAYHR